MLSLSTVDFRSALIDPFLEVAKRYSPNSIHKISIRKVNSNCSFAPAREPSAFKSDCWTLTAYPDFDEPIFVNRNFNLALLKTTASFISDSGLACGVSIKTRTTSQTTRNGMLPWMIWYLRSTSSGR